MNQPALLSPPRHGLHQWWLDRSIRVKGMVVVTVPLVALILIVLASVVLQSNERQERQVALAASALSTSANQVLADAVNAETGVRGYVATGDPLFLEPYNLTLTRVAPDLARLRAAAASEGDRTPERVAAATAARAMAELARLRAAVGTGADASSLRQGLVTGKQNMDLLRRQVGGLAAKPAATDIPVAVLSAEATPGVIRRMLASGVAAYLTKPLDLAELGRLVHSFRTKGHSDAIPGTKPR